MKQHVRPGGKEHQAPRGAQHLDLVEQLAERRCARRE